VWDELSQRIAKKLAIPADQLLLAAVSYENTASHLKPGCAETGIVNGLVEMMGSE
jgi:membrane-bound lytic murein transglycosylase MltF